MSEGSDPLDNEISVSAELTKNGVTGKANLRCLSALDRLIGNVFDQINPWLEKRTLIARAKNHGEVAVIKAVADAAVNLAGKDESFARHAIEVQLRQSERKLANKEAVVIEALENLRETPPNSEEGGEDTPSELNEDWLNFFESYAEKASTENMRKLWGRILSGEIRRPGSFSFTTLRVASELDKETAGLFQDIVYKRLDDLHLVRAEKLTGNSLRQYLGLEASGLIQEAAGNMHLPRTFDDNGVDGVVVDPFFIRIVAKNPKQRSYELPLIALTNAGSQLARILPRDAKATALATAEALRHVAKEASIHAIVQNRDGQVRYSNAGYVVYSEEKTAPPGNG